MPDDAESGWYGLLNILRYQRDVIDASRNQHPEACPRCGTPIKAGPDGSIYCPFDGWRWDGSPEDAYPPAR